jgi:hypothetical protein
VFRAGTSDTPGQDLAPFGNEPTQHIRILIVYFQLLKAEFTDLFFKENLTFAAPEDALIPFPAF